MTTIEVEVHVADSRVSNGLEQITGQTHTLVAVNEDRAAAWADIERQFLGLRGKRKR